jgi:hypothetical protein
LSNDEVVAACKAIEDGDFAQARHHINNLSLEGSNPSQVEELEKLIWRKENEAGKVSLNRIGLALGVAVFGYAILSFQQPPEWGPVIWGLAAFFLLPCFVGVLAGTSIVSGRSTPQRSRRFWRAFFITSITVAVYSLVGMALSRHKMQSSDKSMDFVVFLFVAVVYAAVAGVVSGIAGSIFGSARRAS